MQMAALIHNVNFHRWQIGMLTILLHGIVGSKKTRAGHYRVKRAQHQKPAKNLASLHYLTPAVARIRGSAQYSSTSARKFPATRKTVENSTPPITTYRSRASMASSKRGPIPGQLIMFSTSREPLKTVPTLKPNKAISGLAELRRAYLKRNSRCR